MADTPLPELEESWAFGMLWPKRLLLFEDRIETHSIELLRETVETISYGEIKDVVVSGGGWTASFLIKRGGKPILLRGVEKGAAAHARTLIAERLTQATDRLPRTSPTTQKEIPTRGDLVRKLTELRDAGILSPEEFEVKKRTVEERDR